MPRVTNNIKGSATIDKEASDVVQFKWDGVIYPGLFAELIAADLDEKEEEMWVKKFAEKGLALRTILGPPRTDEEVIIREGINVDATLSQYKAMKENAKE